jgi:ATP-dependent Lon protease
LDAEPQDGQEPQQAQAGQAAAQTEELPRIPEVLPVLALRDSVIYPYVIQPLSVSREKSINAIDAALAENRTILLLSQKQTDIDEPSDQDLHRVGTAALIVRMLKLPDGRLRTLVQGLQRVRVEYFTETSPYIRAKVEPLAEQETSGSIELDATIRSVKQSLEKAIALGKTLPHEVLVIAANLDSPGRLADLVASNLDLKPAQMQDVLEIADTFDRLKKIHEFLLREIELLEVQQKITMEARGEMDKSQRDYYLRQQLKAIQTELGEGNELTEEIEGFRAKLAKLKVPDEAMAEIDRNIKKLERMHPDSSDTAVTRTYLEWMTEMPWGLVSEDNLDLARAKRVLEEDHHGLDKIKERLMEYLAVRKLNPDQRGTILCFVGPPGTGKTSLGRSVARALDRKFARISLGGVHDESEVRGHRRTYVGAMPGRIVQALHSVKTMNPVMMLDEVDKIGRDMRGDPSAALLEVLDPEQNNTFRDNYLNVPVDLSQVLFLANANELDPIQPAFKDRMEIIHLHSYTLEEKLGIAKKHLLPRQLERNGITAKHAAFTDKGLVALIQGYTREAGVRQLEREMASTLRKIARKVAEDLDREGEPGHIEDSGRGAMDEMQNMQNGAGKVAMVPGTPRDAPQDAPQEGAAAKLGADRPGTADIHADDRANTADGDHNGAEGADGPDHAKPPKRFAITEKSLHGLLGPVKFLKDERLKSPRVGVVTGLAWTSTGGDVLFVEALKMPGKGELHLTGQLGDVMKESAKAALSYIRSKGDEFGIEAEVFQKNDIHVHFPEGAIPKDGPSAGLAVATALLSVLKGVPVKHTMAMTGEIDLRGDALPIGGLKEKALAALRMGVFEIIIPAANQKDLEEIGPEARGQLEFRPVKHVEDVFGLALVDWIPPKPKARGNGACDPKGHGGQKACRRQGPAHQGPRRTEKRQVVC